MFTGIFMFLFVRELFGNAAENNYKMKYFSGDSSETTLDKGTRTQNDWSGSNDTGFGVVSCGF